MGGNCTESNTVIWSKFWLEQFLTPIIGCFGIFGNCMAIYTLRHPTMKTTFNQSLVCLAICDSLFIFVMLIDQFVDPNNFYYVILFPYFWNPLSNILMSSQTFLLMSIATERFLAVWMPIVYKTKKPSYSRSFHFLCYILPAIFMATMVNIPKFFETELVTLNVTDTLNNTKGVIDYEVTNLRLDEDYVFYYTVWTRLLITGAIPLIYLSTMNSLIFLAIKKKIPDYSRLRAITSQKLQNLNSKEEEEGEEEEGREIPKVNFPRNKSVTLI